MSVNLSRDGGDRYADSQVVIDAIELALRDKSEDSEIREAFGFGEWRTVTPAHRARYGKYFAQRAYDAICGAFRRAIIGDYKAELTPEEKAQIDKQMEGYQSTEWDGVLPKSLLDEIAQEVQFMTEDGESAEYIEKVRGWMIDDWKAANGINEGYTPEDIALIKKGLIDSAMNKKKPSFSQLGSINCAGFLTVKPVREDRLWPILANDDFHGGSVPVIEGSIESVSLSLAGFGAGFGDIPLSLPVDGMGDDRLRMLVGGPGYGEEFAEEREYIGAVRHLWNFSVACEFEKSGISETVEVNAFPGYALAHIRESFVNERVGLYGWVSRLVSRDVVAYLNKSGANDLVEAWGLNHVESFNALLMAPPAYLGLDHLGRLYRSTALFGGLEAPDAGGGDIGGWEFEYPGLGMDSGASVSAISKAFPRKQRVSWVMSQPPEGEEPVKKFFGLDWLTWQEFDDMANIEYWTGLNDGRILPPVNKPVANARLNVEFSKQVIDGVNESGDG